MPELNDYDWSSIYETKYDEDRNLVDEFFIPALKRSSRYDRIAGYFNSGALAAASRGIESFVEEDGKMRLIAGTELQKDDKDVLEVLEKEISEGDFKASDEESNQRIKLLAWLLKEDRLEIKIAKPTKGNWGIFHPKLGVFRDESDNALSFEGSINETLSGWTRNFERFKVHLSWIDGQESYVKGDIDTFERLWNDEHPYVEVYSLSEALEEKIIEWKAPDSKQEVTESVQKISESKEGPKNGDWATLFDKGGLMPGGIALAEEVSSIDPWPHQRIVSDTVVNTYPNSFLFGDEVGLGKTIEVGLTLSRLIMTDEIESTLILAPAGLMTQWQEELQEKFNLNTWRYERDERNNYCFKDSRGQKVYPKDLEDKADTDSDLWNFVENKRGEGAIVLMSWHTARLEDYWEEVAPDNGKTRHEVTASCRGRNSEDREGVWDAVVVDEAHSARKGTNLLNMLRKLRSHTQAFYLMSATPMQLNSRELYQLLNLMDIPDKWRDEDAFANFFEVRSALKRALEEDTSSSGQQSLAAESQVVQGIMEELDIEVREEAIHNIESCLELFRSSAEHHDRFKEILSDAIADSNISEASPESKKLRELLYPESLSREENMPVTDNQRRRILDELTVDGWEVVLEILEAVNPVESRIFRNTRSTLRKYQQAGVIDYTIPRRNAFTEEIPLDSQSEELRELYERIEDYTRTFYKKALSSEESKRNAIGFVMTTYRQRLASSVAAIQESLETRLRNLKKQKRLIEAGESSIERLEDSDKELLDSIEDVSEFSSEATLQEALDKDVAEVLPELDEEGKSLLEEEIEELQKFIHKVGRFDSDPKIKQLKDDLHKLIQGNHEKIRQKGSHDKVLIFTQYTDTLDYIREELKQVYGDNLGTYTGDGGSQFNRETGKWENMSKEEAKQKFADGNIQILICTDAASEGLNLQTCGTLINYDLPWNPMKVEQRIGRVDRIGQEFSHVDIINYTYEDTVETDIYESLDDRIDLFKDVLGELQPILETVEKEMQEAAMTGESSSESDLEESVDSVKRSHESPVKEELSSVENPDLEEIKGEARIRAWNDRKHPDIGRPGSDSRLAAPYVPETVEENIVGNLVLQEQGVEFESVNVEDKNIEGKTYKLKIGDMTSPQYEEDTLASKVISDSSSMAATFDPYIADLYPSLELILPGNSYFEQIVSKIRDNGFMNLERNIVGGDNCEAVRDNPVVLSFKGTDNIQESEFTSQVDDIQEYCRQFKNLRSSS
ncbi:MAG: helicase-related protein [Candidatus Nanohaloarchaea archaeon]